MSEPTLPYETADGERTAGWSGSDTSHERAVRERDSGTVSERQRRAIDLIARQTGHGMTWKELSDATGWHHGQASGVLSNLHQEGIIDRLTVRRHNCLVYVNPRYVEGRPMSPFRHRRGVSPEDKRRLDNAEARIASARQRVQTAIWISVDDLEALVMIAQGRDA
jgi:hypothetical protein